MNNLGPRNAGEIVATLLVLAAASVSPLIFVSSAAGYAAMQSLALYLLLPALVAWLIIAVAAPAVGWERLWRGLRTGFWAGIAGTVAMEIVRIIGLRVFDAMPGSVPMLMGVLLTDRFMQGPDLWSNLLGWGDHFVNGVGFATIFVLVFGRPRTWTTVLYALAIAIVFMASPVARVTGAGYFGVDFGPGFATTVILAHIAYGLAVGNVVTRSGAMYEPIWRYIFAPNERQPRPVNQ